MKGKNDNFNLFFKRKRLTLTENRLTSFIGKGGWRLGEKSEGIKEKEKTLVEADNSVVIIRWNRRWG